MITHRTPYSKSDIERPSSRAAVAIIGIVSIGIGCSNNAGDSGIAEQTLEPDGIGEACVADDDRAGDAVCADLLCSDEGSENHPFRCDDDVPCPDDLTCNDGICCSDYRSVCGAKCIDLYSDSNHCGSCDASCESRLLRVYGSCRRTCSGVDCLTYGNFFRGIAAGGYHTCGILQQSGGRIVC